MIFHGVDGVLVCHIQLQYGHACFGEISHGVQAACGRNDMQACFVIGMSKSMAYASCAATDREVNSDELERRISRRFGVPVQALILTL
jgi:hypothetical protein